MSDTLAQSIKLVFGSEGGFVNNKNDNGGATKFGITAATLGAWRKLGRKATPAEVKALTLSEATQIVDKQYAQAVHYADLPSPIDYCVFDEAVNAGPVRAAKTLQACLGVGVTQPQLIEEWLMKNDFHAELGHSFEFRGDWGAVSCRILEIDPNQTLVYSWDANGLESTVTWTLAPSAKGTSVRMEQSGFKADQEQFYRGATAGWPRFLASLDQGLVRMD